MIDYIRLLVVLLTVLIVSLPCWLIRAENVKTNERYKQLRFPFLAVVFSIVVSILLSRIERVVDTLVELDAVQNVLRWISPQGKLDYIILLYGTILINVLILYVFLFVKRLFGIGIKSKKVPDDMDDQPIHRRLFWRIVSVFYDIESRKRTLHRNWVKVRYTFRYASWIITALYFMFVVFLQFPVFLSYSWIPFRFMESCMATVYLWPVISVIIVNEIRWYLEGKEETIVSGKVVQDSSEMRDVTSYDELVEQYIKQFPERYCRSITCPAKGTASNFFNEASGGTALKKNIAEQLRTRGFAVNDNYLDCICHLAEGENALIDASLFSDFGDYLFVYLNTLLAHGDNVMFLCADAETAEVFTGYISDKFKSINCFDAVWIVKSSEDIHGFTDADILVLTPQIVLDDTAFVGQRKFFSRLTTVVFVNSAEIIAKEGSTLVALAHRLGNMVHNSDKNRSIRYICLSEGVPPETTNALKQILNTQQDFYTCDGYQSFDNTNLMLWNYESGQVGCAEIDNAQGSKNTLAQDNLFANNKSQTYLGVSLPLACVALKYNVSCITVFSRKGMPYSQMLKGIKKVTCIGDYFGEGFNPDDFDRKILMNCADYKDSHTAFIIVEDDLFNLPLAIYNYCRFGGTDATMIHIVSKPYMLRDYFTAKAEKYFGSESKINMIMPALFDTSQIVITKLLCEAADGGVEKKDFLKRMRIIRPEISSIEEALEVCRDIAYPGQNETPVEYFFSFYKESVFNKDEAVFSDITKIYLKKKASIEEYFKNAKQAKMILRGKEYNTNILAEHLYQHYLPSQSFVYHGDLYVIESINADQGEMEVREASDRLDAPVDYIQVRNYKIKNIGYTVDRFPVSYDNNDQRISGGYEVVVNKHADIHVDTIGYYSLNAATAVLNLDKGPTYKPLSDEDRQAAHRHYENASFVSFRITGVGADRADKTAFLLSVMMNEMMKTIFPYSYCCIAVCPVLADPETIFEDPMGGKISRAYPRVEMEGGYEHAPENVEVLIIEDSNSDTGMIQTLLRDVQRPFALFFSTIVSYLTWYDEYKEPKDSNISKKYLHFGSDKMPDCFDAETLQTICSEFITIDRQNAIRVNRITSKGQCSYCHRELSQVRFTEINDNAGRNNRKLCADCAKLIVTDIKTRHLLYQNVRNYLTTSFGIELPEDITVRFATAEIIRRKCKTGRQRVVVGFADPNTRELWVEADAPSPNVREVMAHELTHFWQFDNLEGTNLEDSEGRLLMLKYSICELRGVQQWLIGTSPNSDVGTMRMGKASVKWPMNWPKEETSIVFHT